MPSDLNLVFADKGSAGVLRALAKLKAEAKSYDNETKQQARDQTTLIRQIGAAYRSTQTEVEKLKERAALLRGAIENPLVPKVDKQKAEKALESINNEIKDVESNSGSANEALSEAFGNPTALLGPFATGVGAISVAIKAVTDELRAAQQLANDAAQTQVSVAASRKVTIRNLDGVSEEQIRAVLRENQRIARETGVSEAAINVARGEALSSSGNDIAASRKAVRVAAQFLPDQPGQVARFLGSLLDLAAVTKTDDALANLGFLKTVGSRSRVASAANQARNIPVALVGAVNNGLSPRAAAAGFAALSNAGKDTEGATTGTALIALSEKLKSFSGTKEVDLRGLTPDQKLNALRSDQALAEAFFGDGEGFEKKARAPILQLLTNRSSEAAREFDKSRSAFPDIAGLRRKGQESIAALSIDPLESRAQASRAIASAAEQSKLAAAKKFLDDTEIEQVQKLLQRGGSGLTAAKLSILLAKGLDGKVSFQEASDLLQGQADFAAGRPGRNTRNESVSDETIDILRRLATELEKGNRLTVQANADRKQQTEALRTGGITVGGE